jgi:exportin-7
VREDIYLERFKFLKILMTMLSKCITGGYINFAVCDFYNDNSFSELCTLVLKAILNQNISEIQNYPKVNLTLYSFIEQFFKKHLELVFLKIDLSLVK